MLVVYVGRQPNTERYLKILRAIEQGHGLSSTARILNISPSAALKHFRRLLEFKYITVSKDTYPHVYKLTPKGVVALKRGVLTLSRYVRERRGRPKRSTPPAQGVIRLHNLQIVIPILKKGRPLPIKKKNELNNWTQHFLELPAPIDGTIEVTPRNVRIYIKETEVPRGYKGYLQLLNKVMKTVFMVHSALLQYGWVLDALEAQIPTQHIATTMPEFDKADLQASEVYLNRKAKGLGGRVNKQEARAWIDRSKGVLEIETNDAAYEEKLILMPERMDELGRFARSHEQFMATLTSQTLPELNALLTKLNKKLEKL